jgi:hypothetical protein
VVDDDERPDEFTILGSGGGIVGEFVINGLSIVAYLIK